MDFGHAFITDAPIFMLQFREQNDNSVLWYIQRSHRDRGDFFHKVFFVARCDHAALEHW
jgi:hypothetical protein